MNLSMCLNFTGFGRSQNLQKECFWLTTIANNPCTPLHIAANNMSRGERWVPWFSSSFHFSVQDRQILERCNLKWWNAPEYWYITGKKKWQQNYHKLVLYHQKTICGVSATFTYPKDFRYLIVGLAVSEDKIDGSLDVAVLEVMPSLLVV